MLDTFFFYIKDKARNTKKWILFFIRKVCSYVYI